MMIFKTNLDGDTGIIADLDNCFSNDPKTFSTILIPIFLELIRMRLSRGMEICVIAAHPPSTQAAAARAAEGPACRASSLRTFTL